MKDMVHRIAKAVMDDIDKVPDENDLRTHVALVAGFARGSLMRVDDLEAKLNELRAAGDNLLSVMRSTLPPDMIDDAVERFKEAMKETLK